MQKLIAIFVVLAVAIAGGSFYAGMAYQKSQTPSFALGQGRFGGMMGQGGANGQGRQGGQGGLFVNGQRPVSGEIISKDDKSITVKMQDGSTKIVMLPNNAVINKQATGSIADLKQGERVMAMGKENSDGSVTATMVQLGDRLGFGARPQQGQQQQQQ